MDTITDLPYMKLLPPETAAAISRLEYLARGKMQGIMSGRHASPNKGFSVIFAEHRQYTPGDNIRDLDWRVLGKSGRYYIKQYVEETNLRATIALDCSGSMAYEGKAATQIGGSSVSKLAYGRYLAAALAYLMVRQQDAVGLVTFDSSIRQFIKAASRPSQVRHVLQELYRTEPGAETALAPVLHQVAERIPRRGLVVLITDAFDEPGPLVEALHHFAFNSHEVVLFHIMADEELTFPFKDFNDFRDLELPTQRLKIDPASVRAAYLEKVRHHIATLEKACGEMKADYVPVNTKVPLDQVLIDYLGRRGWR